MQNNPQKLSLKEKFKQSKLGKELISLREEMKPMSWKQRFDHIWTYYKEYIGLIALGLFITIGLISSMISANKNAVVTGIMVNITMDQEAYNYLSTDYADYLGLSDSDEVRLEYTSFYDLEINPSEENYYAAMIVINEVSAKMLDYMILDHLGMEFYAGQEVYMDLTEFFTEEELADFAEKGLLIYCMEEEEQVRWPAAVKITDMDYVKNNVTNEGDIYFALAGSSDKIEEVRQVWEYMKAWKAE